MKTFLLCIGMLGLLVLEAPGLLADDKAGLSQGGSKILSILSPADKEKFLAARTKALEENPGFKAEGDDLMRQAQVMHDSDATPEEKQAFGEKVMAHQQKLREMMLKDDPTLQPIFDQLDQILAELRERAERKLAEAQAQRQSSGAGTATPPNSTNTNLPGQ